jgi:hypothetical protein
MPKNIVLCCDGTNNQFSSDHTNVIRAYKVAVHSAQQVKFYECGVGTMPNPWDKGQLVKRWSMIEGLAFGSGFMQNIEDAYRFLMSNYEPGDQVYLFGFSRGAYTARRRPSGQRPCSRRGRTDLVGLSLRPRHQILDRDGGRPFGDNHPPAGGLLNTGPQVLRPLFNPQQKGIVMSANAASNTNTLALLDRLKTEMPEIWQEAQIVGKWVWLEFNVPPMKEIRARLKEFILTLIGAGEGNRTLVSGLGSPRSTIEPHPQTWHRFLHKLSRE